MLEKLIEILPDEKSHQKKRQKAMNQRCNIFRQIIPMVSPECAKIWKVEVKVKSLQKNTEHSSAEANSVLLTAEPKRCDKESAVLSPPILSVQAKGSHVSQAKLPEIVPESLSRIGITSDDLDVVNTAPENVSTERAAKTAARIKLSTCVDKETVTDVEEDPEEDSESETEKYSTAEEEEETSCLVCTRIDDGDVMLLCEDCDRGCHTFCNKPPLSSVPDGPYRCYECALTFEKSNPIVEPSMELQIVSTAEPSPATAAEVQDTGTQARLTPESLSTLPSSTLETRISMLFEKESAPPLITLANVMAAPMERVYEVTSDIAKHISETFVKDIKIRVDGIGTNHIGPNMGFYNIEGLKITFLTQCKRSDADFCTALEQGENPAKVLSLLIKEIHSASAFAFGSMRIVEEAWGATLRSLETVDYLSPVCRSIDSTLRATLASNSMSRIKGILTAQTPTVAQPSKTDAVALEMDPIHEPTPIQPGPQDFPEQENPFGLAKTDLAQNGEKNEPEITANRGTKRKTAVDIMDELNQNSFVIVKFQKKQNQLMKELLDVFRNDA